MSRGGLDIYLDYLLLHERHRDGLPPEVRNPCSAAVLRLLERDLINSSVDPIHAAAASGSERSGVRNSFHFIYRTTDTKGSQPDS